MLLEVVLGILLLCALWQICKKPQGLPPGLWGLPLIGHVMYPPILKKDKIMHMREKYGDIFLIRIGTSINVFLCRYDLCKEALSMMEFAGKKPWKIFDPLGFGDGPLGIFASSGNVWHNGRRFALRHLRALGLGKTSMIDAIQLEAREMIKCFEKANGQLTGTDKFINLAVLNVVWQLVTSRRYSLHDQEIMRFHKLIHDIQDTFNRLSIGDFFPWFTKILPSWLERKLCVHDALHYFRDQLREYFQKSIDEHKTSLDPENPRDFIDAYLIEMDKQKDNPDNIFSEENLLISTWDLFFGGSETVAATMRWLLLYMVKYPDIQKKVQMEIDETIPRHQQPSWEDKDKMPYTEATIHEVLRITSLATNGIQHCAMQDTMLRGYKIPKGTILHPVAFCVHSHDTYWNKPSEFRPERFMDGNKFVKPRDGFMPFSLGRRQCIGEPLARMELFIFCTSLLQKLSFSAGPQGVSLETRDIPIITLPYPQMIKVDIREEIQVKL